jgi:protocatechuate 3,4-dioxygenase beta subunit
MARPAQVALAGVAALVLGGLAWWLLGSGGGPGTDTGSLERPRRPDAGAAGGDGTAGASKKPEKPLAVGTLRAVVLGGGKPVAATLEAQCPLPGGFDGLSTGGAPSGDGALELPGVPAGIKVRVVVSSPGWRTVTIEDVVVDAGAVKDLGTIGLEKALPATGRVLDPAGKPFPGATVGAVSSENAPRFDLRRLGEMFLREPDWKAKTVTDREGAFALDALGAGSWRLVATAPGFAPSDEEEIVLHPAGTAPPVSLVLQVGHALVVRVTGAGGAPVAGAEVGAALQSGRGPPTGAAAGARGVTDAAGEARLSGVGAGRVAVAVRASEGRLAVRTVEVPRSAELAIRLDGTASILVRVRDQAGAPVEGAEVSGIVLAGGAMDSGETLSGKSGAEGTAKFERLGPGRLLFVTAEKEGFAALAPDPMSMGMGGEEIKEGQTLEKEVVLKAGATITGTVRRRPGDEPVPGARVTASSSASFFGGAPRTAVADGSGVYRIEGVGEGKAGLSATADGLVSPEAWSGSGNPFMPQPGGQAVPEGQVDVPAGPAEVKKDVFVEETGTVFGKVLGPTGDGLGGARVEIAAAASFNFRGMFGNPVGNLIPGPVLTGPDGSFEVKGVPAGKDLQARASAPNLLGASSANFTLAAGGAATGIEVRLAEGGTVLGRISGPGGAPVAGAKVRASSRPANDRNMPMFFDPATFRRLEATTDADGQYRIANVPPGTGNVLVQAQGFVDGNRGELVFAAGTETRADVALEPGRAIAGIVLDAGGVPIEGARVSTSSPAASAPSPRPGVTRSVPVGAGDRFFPGRNAVTDAKGAFRVEGLAAGAYNVTANAQGLAPRTVEGVAAGTESVEIRLLPAVRISGKVVDAEGNAIRNARVLASNEGGEASSGFARTSADGTFVLEGLLAGTYRINAQSFDGKLARAELKGVAGGATDLLITLPKALEIRGKVVGPDGGVPKGMGFILASDASGGSSAPARWDAEGAFTLGGLAEGTWTLTARIPGTFQGTATAKAGQEGVEIRLVALPAAPDSGGGSPSPLK